jgi:hypothetical protein
MRVPRQKPSPTRTDRQHGIVRDSRGGEDQPADKSRAQQTSVGEQSAGQEAQRDAATTQPISPGQPAGGE